MTLADDGTPDEEALWVGAPLRAHRRCDEPMFGIANEIAYEGLMIHATRPEESALPESCWIDAPGSANGGHWIPEQGSALVAAMAEVVAAGRDPGEIIAVSPFRSVAEQIGRLCARRPFRGVRSGTVHTFQGKEAQVVFLVLGGDPRKIGARRFATERPNLVNVAVTRARRRLYVIGDHASWKSLPYFDVLAARLPMRGGLASHARAARQRAAQAKIRGGAAQNEKDPTAKLP